MKKLLFLFIFTLSFQASFACINEYRTKLHGEVYQVVDPSSGKFVPPPRLDRIKIMHMAESDLITYRIEGSLDSYSDYGAKLIYLGRLEEAQKVYEEIESKEPHRYATASNLGTLYELMGENEKAFFWIKKGMKLNPNSHHGSEWIHIKILEHKLNPVPNVSILGLDFGKKAKPSNPERKDLTNIRDHIYTQLYERSTFIHPPNYIMGNIFFDLGNILAQTNDVEAALQSYRSAASFGFESELMEKRIQKMEKLSKRGENGSLWMGFQFFFSQGIAFVLGFIALFVWLVYKTSVGHSAH